MQLPLSVLLSNTTAKPFTMPFQRRNAGRANSRNEMGTRSAAPDLPGTPPGRRFSLVFFFLSRLRSPPTKPGHFTYENVPLTDHSDDERSFTAMYVHAPYRLTDRVHEASRSVSHLSSAMTSAAAPGWRQQDDGSDC
ncbi:hypothetical protein V8C34DRAFT_289792 [Trichoderma compactum]